jgi:predicted lipoprotein
LVTARNLRGALDALLADPAAATHQAAKEAWLAARLPHQQAEAIALPLHAAVEDPKGRAQVEALLAEVKSLRLLVGQDLAPALGLLIGFNAMDGD